MEIDSDIIDLIKDVLLMILLFVGYVKALKSDKSVKFSLGKIIKIRSSK